MKNFYSYIRSIRVKKGLSQENMAHDLNISVTAYSKIERGMTNISLDRLRQIAKSLNVTMSSLIGYYEDENYSVYYDRRTHNRSNYLYVSDYGGDSNIYSLESRIIDLEESLRILARTVDNLKSIIQEVFKDKNKNNEKDNNKNQ